MQNTTTHLYQTLLPLLHCNRNLVSLEIQTILFSLRIADSFCANCHQSASSCTAASSCSLSSSCVSFRSIMFITTAELSKTSAWYQHESLYFECCSKKKSLPLFVCHLRYDLVNSTLKSAYMSHTACQTFSKEPFWNICFSLQTAFIFPFRTSYHISSSHWKGLILPHMNTCSELFCVLYFHQWTQIRRKTFFLLLIDPVTCVPRVPQLF